MTFDLAHHLGATKRSVIRRDHEGAPAWVVVAERLYGTDVEDLWDAITSPERIPRWFLPITGDLRLGGRYQLEGNAGGEITRCEPPRTLAVTWEIGGQVSWVIVSLSPEGERALLRLEHVARAPEAMWAEYGPGAVGVGWDLALLGLATHLSSGAAVDRAAAEAWAMSEEGRRFSGQLSDAWGEASIAAGTPQDEARAAARRTAAFYSGTPS